MALHTHEIPILEYDTDPSAVIDPTVGADNQPVHLPARAVFVFLGDTVDRYALAHGAETLAEFETITKVFPVYRILHRGQELCLCQAPLGASASVQFLDWLIGHGVKNVISAGSCGALVPLSENAFLVPTRALRDEGASYHYLPPARFVETSEAVREVILRVLDTHGLKYTECVTWTTDGFFRETRDMVAHRREEGCAVVEMECAALAACAQFRGARFGQLLYTADSLADTANYDARDWGKDSLEPALALCLDIAAELP